MVNKLKKLMLVNKPWVISGACAFVLLSASGSYLVVNQNNLRNADTNDQTETTQSDEYINESEVKKTENKNEASNVEAPSTATDNTYSPTEVTEPKPVEASPRPSTTKPKCNEAAMLSLTNDYTTELAAAKSAYDAEIDRIGKYYAAKGAYDSGSRINAQAQETTRYSQQVSELDATYASNLQRINCSS
jgi:hypothetical protein